MIQHEGWNRETTRIRMFRRKLRLIEDRSDRLNGLHLSKPELFTEELCNKLTEALTNLDLDFLDDVIHNLALARNASEYNKLIDDLSS